MSSDVLMTAFVDKALEMDLVDCLIECDFVSGFTLSNVNGFSREHAKLDQAERVAGCRMMIKAEVIHDTANTQRLLQLLADLNGRFPIRYTITSLLQHGVVRARQ